MTSVYIMELPEHIVNKIMLYNSHPVADCFKNEFGQIAQLEVVTDPASLASKGYALHSLRISGGDKSTSIGLDIGNATTVVTRLTE